MEERIRIVWTRDGQTAIINPVLKSKKDNESFEDFYRRTFTKAMKGLISSKLSYTSLGELENIEDLNNWKPESNDKCSVVTGMTREKVIVERLPLEDAEKHIKSISPRLTEKQMDEWRNQYKNYFDYDSSVFSSDWKKVKSKNLFFSIIITDCFSATFFNFPGMKFNKPQDTIKTVMEKFIKPIVEKHTKEKISTISLKSISDDYLPTKYKEFEKAEINLDISSIIFVGNKALGLINYYHDHKDHVLSIGFNTSYIKERDEMMKNRDYSIESTYIPETYQDLNRELRNVIQKEYTSYDYIDIEKSKMPKTYNMSALEFKDGKLVVNDERELADMKLNSFYALVEKEKAEMKKEKEDAEVLERMKAKGIL